MIAFGSAILDPEAYRRFALPGIRRVAEPGSAVLRLHAVGTVCRGYNLLLDAAAKHDDLEALVLVDPRLELTGKDFCARVRDLFADPGVAIAGCIGARGVRSIAWWDGDVSRGPLTQRYYEHGGGEIPALDWTQPGPAGSDVDAVGGMLLVLSPWAVRTLRFDEGLVEGLGHDVDLCLQARDAGRRVVTAPFDAVHHHSLELVRRRDIWTQGHIHAAEKWDRRTPGREQTDEEWRARARRAEAERDAVRTVAYSSELRVDAELAALERELEAIATSPSWRMTRPLRALNRRLRGR
jgi:hypothetical protein